jgi:hypothetical protein
MGSRLADHCSAGAVDEAAVPQAVAGLIKQAGEATR